MKTPLQSAGTVVLAAFLCAAPRIAHANIAPEGIAIIGVHYEINAEEGTPYEHVGTAANINDGDTATRVDTWNGGQPHESTDDFSYVGVVWPALREDAVSRLKLTFATFFDGGWFGPREVGPGAGGVLGTEPVNYLIEPQVQISADGGLTWSDVEFTSNYIATMTGHGIGGGANPNPTSRMATFILNTPQAGIDGIRIIGESGGQASRGFIGVFELEVEVFSSDSDNDGMDDEWETLNGLNVGVNDAALDPDEDGLTNLQEFNAGTNPQVADTDGDGLSDGAEVNTHQTDPLVADSDGDGLSDGAEVNTHQTNPKLADTDGDLLTDGQEVNTYGTNPLVTDSDGDGFADGIEVRMGTNPALANSIPANLAPSGTAILGTSTEAEDGFETPHANAGVAANINDALYTSRVDTFGRSDPYCYVGVVWDTPLTQSISRVELTMAVFFDGGWFGPGGMGPGTNNYLTHDPDDPDFSYLEEPLVQVTTDGTTWSTVGSASNYLSVFNGHPLPTADFGAPTTATAVFVLDTPLANLRGVRLMGSEGGTASAGFLGVWEFAAIDAARTDPNIAREGSGIMGVIEEIGDQPGVRLWQAGIPVNINDGNYDTRVDNWNANANNHIETIDFPASFVGILWPEPREVAVDRLEVTFSIFGDGGWFGVNAADPGGGGMLQAPDFLAEPAVQVTGDGGRTWTTVPHTSNYIAALTGQVIPGPEGLRSATVIFALDTPAAGIDGIRLIGTEGGTSSSGFLGIFEVEVKDVSTLGGPNPAFYATGIIGTNDAIDDDSGRLFPHIGLHRHVNDGNANSRVDTWDGGEGVEPVSYAGLLWPTGRKASIDSLDLTLATFTDGGWFGPPGVDPGPGGVLAGDTYLTEPTIQVTADGVTWTTAAHTSDYLTVFEGHGIGGGANPNPTRATAHFNLTPPQTGIVGLRIIGNAGGASSGGFLGVFELEATGPPPVGMDSDGDGQSDAAEAIAGTDPNDPKSVFRALSATTAGNQFTIEWSSVPGKTYQVQVSPLLTAGGWAPVGAQVPAAAGPATTTQTTLTLPVPAPDQQNYRVIVVTP